MSYLILDQIETTLFHILPFTFGSHFAITNLRNAIFLYFKDKNEILRTKKKLKDSK